jgi:aryl-alcohol dehydrogenase-like predicted oxidoreductase
MKKVELTPGYEISPVIKGGWQLSTGHSLHTKITEENAINDILAFVDSGISTLDFGDIYTGVEELVGKALKRINDRASVQLHTKYVPNDNFLESYDRSDARTIARRSLDRLGVDQVELVQFHWWRYEAHHYLEALEELFTLKEEGLIREVGITNFDLPRVQEMVRAGFKPASIQLQYSILDRRPEEGMVDYCLENSIGILCYGTVAGGFLSERYLNVAEPDSFETRSNVKYKLIIDDFGGWNLFQELLHCLDRIAKNHGTDIGTVASAYTLNRPGVTAVIVGARNTDHIARNLQISEIALTDLERSEIGNVLEKSTGPVGPVYDLERNNDRHRNIMHTNNN